MGTTVFFVVFVVVINECFIIYAYKIRLSLIAIEKSVISLCNITRIIQLMLKNKSEHKCFHPPLSICYYLVLLYILLHYHMGIFLCIWVFNLTWTFHCAIKTLPKLWDDFVAVDNLYCNMLCLLLCYTNMHIFTLINTLVPL